MARSTSTDPNDILDRLSNAHLDRDCFRETWALASYMRPYRRRFFVGLASLLSNAGVSLLFPLLAGGLIDAAMNEGRAVFPILGSLTLNQIALTLAVCVFGQLLTKFGSALSFRWVGQHALADLRAAAYGRLLVLPMAFFGQRRVGELTNRVSTDIAQIEEAITTALPNLFRQAVFLTGGLVLIAITSLPLTLVMLGTLPLLIAVALFFGRRLRRFSRDAQDCLGDSQTIVAETLLAIASVKAFANERFEQVRYASANGATLATALQEARWRAVFVAFFTAALFGGITILLWYGAVQLQAGALSGGELTRFVIYTVFVGGAMAESAELFSKIQKAVGATQRVREILQEPAESESVAKDNQNADPLVGRLRGEVAFDHVSFRYPSRPDTSVLHDINLVARPGERIALVGPSGAGKSTLTALLLRFYEPDAGTLLIDGRDARSYPLHGLRNQMALVPQDVLLFGGSILANIAYGRPGVDFAAIEAAARQANAHDFINAFSDGYATLVGDRGIKLSGGQRQRIAIARALLKDPAILILDEATSSLDSESESLVQNALDHLMEGRTTFVIAHRLATIRNVDRIAVIDGGRVVETGTHEELSARPSGLYRRLSLLQFGDLDQTG
jgi:ABC-type multidrug transport system fused ATPase/permease subunit